MSNSDIYNGWCQHRVPLTMCTLCRIEAITAERDAALVEIERLTAMLADEEQARCDHAAELRRVAERQREVCAVYADKRLRDLSRGETVTDLIRATPLVTDAPGGTAKCPVCGYDQPHSLESLEAEARLWRRRQSDDDTTSMADSDAAEAERFEGYAAKHREHVNLAKQKKWVCCERP